MAVDTSLRTSSAPDVPPERPPGLGPLGLSRWAWRQLTSMRTALVLLFLLALAAVPGSIVPQRTLNPQKVANFFTDHPHLAPWFDRFRLFDVFGSPWFAAVYLLLMTSLVGCVLPRAWQHLKAATSRPPAAPRHLSRLPYTGEVPAGERAQALQVTARALRRRRYRVVVDEAAGTVSAERGYLKETGNLVFHVSLLVLLVAVGLGSAFGFKGDAIVVEGQGFANTYIAYDDFTAGRAYDTDDLEPFSFTLDRFSATYQASGDQKGAPRTYEADVTYTSEPGATPRTDRIQVNHPLDVDGSKVFLVNHGYAPRFTVRDGSGRVVLSNSPVVFIPVETKNWESRGAIKVADASPQQLGFEAIFLPTADLTGAAPKSSFPAANDPEVLVNAFRGDLQLDSGVPQSVYSLDDKSKLTQLTANGSPWIAGLRVGQTATLPGGAGSITFDGVSQWAAFQVASDPGKGIALGGAIAAVAGLMLSMAVRRRRVWARVAPAADGRSVLQVGGLSRSESGDFTEEFDELTGELTRDLGAPHDARVTTP